MFISKSSAHLSTIFYASQPSSDKQAVSEVNDNLFQGSMINIGVFLK